AYRPQSTVGSAHLDREPSVGVEHGRTHPIEAPGSEPSCPGLQFDAAGTAVLGSLLVTAGEDHVGPGRGFPGRGALEPVIGCAGVRLARSGRHLRSFNYAALACFASRKRVDHGTCDWRLCETGSG